MANSEIYLRSTSSHFGGNGQFSAGIVHPGEGIITRTQISAGIGITFVLAGVIFVCTITPKL